MKHYLIALAVAAGSLAAQATEGSTVYRCGSSYQQTPCTGGRAIEADDERTAAEVAAAKYVATLNRQQADAMARERERQEAAITPASATGIGPAPVVQPASRSPKAAGKHRFRKKTPRAA